MTVNGSNALLNFNASDLPVRGRAAATLDAG